MGAGGGHTGATMKHTSITRAASKKPELVGWVSRINSLFVYNMCFVFFFSSRRRHTRCSRDWSSDVCSSDLLASRLQSRHFLASRRRRFDLVSLPRGSWVAGLGLVFPCCRGHFRV